MTNENRSVFGDKEGPAGPGQGGDALPPAVEMSQPPPEVAGVGEKPGEPVVEEPPSLFEQVKKIVIGKPRDLFDKSVFRHVSLVAFLAWVGLGADGLSSSCYGPAEAFINLGEHRYLAVFLAAAIAATVFIISACYSHLIEDFPSGGGGYLVASKLLGPRVGVVAGSALVIDYVLTITVSIAAAGDALFGLAGLGTSPWKLQAEYAAIAVLIILNLRGVRESVQVLLPIFMVFLITHAVLIGGALALNLPALGTLVHGVASEVSHSMNDPQIGLFGMLGLLMYAYSLGAGTYTGIEAVSNSMPVMREPRVATAKRTMRYMAFSLALTAGGLIVGYLLLNISHAEGKTLNHILCEALVTESGASGTWLGTAFIFTTLIAEGALLVVAAQAGFIGGPRTLANMAYDSWLPRWFAHLSERLAVYYGILLMGGLALVALAYTQGNVRVLVTMYAINVFVTFSLSMLGMCRRWWRTPREHPFRLRRLALFMVGAVLCLGILAVTIWEKFTEGAWVTLLVTGSCVVLCFAVRRYYDKVGEKLRKLDAILDRVATDSEPNLAVPDPTQPTAVILVGGYSGLGVHTMLNTIRYLPNYFKSFIFISAGVIDSGNFKGSEAVEDLRQHTEDSLRRYVDLARRLGMPATYFMAIGTDAVDDLEELCRQVAQQYPKAIFFAGQIVFQKDSWLQRLLHNQTAYSLQRRLQWSGLPMVILPTRVR